MAARIRRKKLALDRLEIELAHEDLQRDEEVLKGKVREMSFWQPRMEP